MCFWVQSFQTFCWECLHTCVPIHQGYWSIVLLCYFFWFWNWGDARLREGVWEVSLPYLFWMVWELEISNGLKIRKKSSENPSRPWVFFVQRLFITDSISILIMGFLFFYFENYFSFLVFMSQNRQIICVWKISGFFWIYLFF